MRYYPKMNYLSRVSRWLCGWRHSRGYGVQSPSDYSFLMEVIKGDKSELYYRIARYSATSPIIMELNEGTYIEAKSHIAKSKEGDVVVLEMPNGTYGNKLWKSIKEETNSTITFEMYYVGIILIEPRRYKKNYVVNY